MDMKAPVKEVTSELSRELLIAISQLVPDELLNSKVVYEDINGFHGTVMPNEDTTEELRSELISISNVPQPENSLLPGISSPKA